mmetsp:Transcript_15072/g.31288  ORF Transcript_15072/g.31288 Transcript_15072/m.31288 type:complete len:221 (+) Transcript_15072:91-753(+)
MPLASRIDTNSARPLTPSLSSSCTSATTLSIAEKSRAEIPRSTSSSPRSTSIFRSETRSPSPKSSASWPDRVSTSHSEVVSLDSSAMAATLPTTLLTGPGMRKSRRKAPGKRSLVAAACSATSSTTDRLDGLSVPQPDAPAYEWIRAFPRSLPIAPRLASTLFLPLQFSTSASYASRCGSKQRTLPPSPTRSLAHSAKSPTFAPTSTTMSPFLRSRPWPA